MPSLMLSVAMRRVGASNDVAFDETNIQDRHPPQVICGNVVRSGELQILVGVGSGSPIINLAWICLLGPGCKWQLKVN